MRLDSPRGIGPLGRQIRSRAPKSIPIRPAIRPGWIRCGFAQAARQDRSAILQRETVTPARGLPFVLTTVGRRDVRSPRRTCLEERSLRVEPEQQSQQIATSAA